MGEGKGDVTRKRSPPRDPFQLEREIDTLRSELGRLVDELDRRRHEAFDLRLQIGKHPVAAGMAAAAVAAAVGGTVAFLVWSRRRRQRPMERIRRARSALVRLLDDPDRIAREPRVAEKMLAAAGTAAASTLVRRVVARAFGQMRIASAPA
jgi:hypothetical protein